MPNFFRRLSSFPVYPVPMKSNMPLGETVDLLLKLNDIRSRDELFRQVERHGWPTGRSSFYRLLNGEREFDVGLLEIVAEALQVDPETFAEYRLWRAKRPYEPREVGFDTAMRNLSRLEEAEDLDGAEPTRHPPGKHLRPLGGNGEQAASS